MGALQAQTGPVQPRANTRPRVGRLSPLRLVQPTVCGRAHALIGHARVAFIHINNINLIAREKTDNSVCTDVQKAMYTKKLLRKREKSRKGLTQIFYTSLKRLLTCAHTTHAVGPAKGYFFMCVHNSCC